MFGVRGSTRTIGGSIWYKEDIHSFCTTSFILKSIIKSIFKSISQQPEQSNINQTSIMLPQARSVTRSRGLFVAVAGTASASPLLLFVPGFEERLASQAAKWGPRWNRGFSHLTPRIEKHAMKIDPKMQKGVKMVEPPFKRAAV